MAVEVWIGEKPEHPNERKAIIALANGLDRLEGLYLMVANFSVGGNTIDLVIIKHDAIFIIELKHCDGRVFGAVNGQWRVISDSGYTKVLNPGRKNPYNQVIAYYYSFINFLNANRTAFLSEQKAGTIDFRACRRVVVIAPTLQEGSEVDVDWKVAVKGLDELPTYLVTERSSEINLTDAEMRAIPALLHCVPWQEVNDLVAGVMPDWSETPDDPAPAQPPPALEQQVPLEQGPEPAGAAGGLEVMRRSLRRHPLRATLLSLGAITLLMVLLFTGRPDEPTQAGTQLPTQQPGIEIIPSVSQPINGCVYPVQQPVRKRKDPETNQWITVDISVARQPELPDVVVTLEQVEFCDNRVVLRWSVKNLGSQTVRMPLTNKNLHIFDNTQLDYLIDESASEPREIVVRPGSIKRGAAVIPRPINPSASAITIHLNSEPFPTDWPVAVPHEILNGMR